MHRFLKIQFDDLEMIIKTDSKQEDINLREAKKMNEIANGIFAPIYPIIADKIVKELNVLQGTCVDIGSGPGSLSIALAKITNLQMVLLDSSKEMHQYALNNICTNHLQNRCRLLPGDVHRIPLASNRVDLVISRGSVFFWDDLDKAFREIYRILAPGKRSFIGGGFGNSAVAHQVSEQMLKVNPDWKTLKGKNLSRNNRDRIKNTLKTLEIEFSAIEDDSEFWITIEKESQTTKIENS